MTGIAQVLRDEHQRLLPQIDELRVVGDLVGRVSSVELDAEIEGLHRFLADFLVPHAKAEEQVLYPVVARIMGAPEATATMVHDHQEIQQLIVELEAVHQRVRGVVLDEVTEHELRRLLYGLHTLIKAHFGSEEAIYVPLLELGLAEEEAADLVASFARVEHEQTHQHTP